MKKILVLMMALVMVLGMTACGSSSTPAGDVAEITVTMEIDFPDGSNVADVEDAQVIVPEGSSVYDVLKAYADANNVEVVLEESSTSDYVSSIGGVAQTENSGWVYEVNDEMVMESATTCVANNGDVVDWEVQSW